MTFNRPQENNFRRNDYRQDAPVPPPVPPPPDPALIRAIIVDGDPEKLVDLAETIGKTVAKQYLSTNQIRNVYGTVRQIQLRWDTNPGKSYREAVLLRPKIAYYAEKEKKASRKKTTGMETLQVILEPAIRLLSEADLTDDQRKTRYNYFTDFFEAIVAYHRKYGGTE